MKIIKIIFLSVLAYTLATAVVLASVHARDIVANSNKIVHFDAVSTAKVHTDDVAAKAIGDLHNHVDKTFVKSMVKSVSEQATLIRQRQSLEDLDSIDRPLSVLVMEMLLMFRLSYASILARAY